jgi:hypothetical protein
MADSCPEFRLDVVRLAYGEEVGAAAREHIRTCPACSGEEQALACISRALPAAPLPPGVRDRLVALGSARRPPAFRVGLTAAAAVLLLLGGGLFVAFHVSAPVKPDVSSAAVSHGNALERGASREARPAGMVVAQALPLPRPASSRDGRRVAKRPARGSSSSEAWRAGLDVSLAAIARRLEHLEDDGNFE